MVLRNQHAQHCVAERGGQVKDCSARESVGGLLVECPPYRRTGSDNLRQSGYGCALMSPRPNTTLADCWILVFY
jgi:hypothetical protein